MISAIVLAAGLSSRMGRSKLRLGIKGKPMLQHVIDAARQSKAGEVIVVLGAEADTLRREIDTGDARVVANPRYREGLSTSLKTGLKAVSPQSQAAVILMGDQPFVTPAIIDALIERYRQPGSRIVAPVYGGRRGNPALFDRSLFPELMSVTGDKGGREIIETHPEWLETVTVDDDLAGRDIDTAEEYRGSRDL
ncbi:MAG: molybdenum cofactor cytidylyltransferase [Chloroflexi bacterium]|nr:molybdenum cofactor cytidylyltransferase [Chloroflexota bacterium]